MKTIKIFKYDELSNEAQEKALQKCHNINVFDDWAEHIIDEAAEIGLKIDTFNDYKVTGDFTEYPMDVVKAIFDAHDKETDTYHDALNYWDDVEETYTNLLSADMDDDDKELLYEDIQEEKEGEFLHDLCETYRIILRRELEYLYSDEMIIKSTEAYEHYFLADGTLV